MKNLLGIGGLAAALAVLLGSGTPVPLAIDQDQTASWTVDSSHSEVGFSARHFFTPVRGEFTDYEVNLEFDPENPEASSVEATISIASVDTGSERRDNHLRTDDWFDAERLPTMTFRSSSVRQVSETEFVATGDLTIKETTMEVELPITLLGIMDVPEERQERMGTHVAGFEASLTIDRRDFGVGTGSWAETAVVGPDVEISILVEAGRK